MEPAPAAFRLIISGVFEVTLVLQGEAMFLSRPFFRLLKILIILAVAISFNGCGEKPRPPLFNLYGYQRVAIVPFANQTRDPALAKAVQDEMTDEIVSLNAVPVIQAEQVGAYLK